MRKLSHNEAITTDTLAVANGLIGMPFTKKASPDFFIENALSLQETFTNIRTELSQANASFASINKLLGINLTANTVNQQYLAELLALMKNNGIIVSTWFTEDLTKTKGLVEEAKAHAIRLIETKSRILANWEPEILALDYSPILLRYKTAYTSFFKIFHSQYRSDKKQLQALSKTVIKKLPDYRKKPHCQRNISDTNLFWDNCGCRWCWRKYCRSRSLSFCRQSFD